MDYEIFFSLLDLQTVKGMSGNIRVLSSKYYDTEFLLTCDTMPDKDNQGTGEKLLFFAMVIKL